MERSPLASWKGWRSPVLVMRKPPNAFLAAKKCHIWQIVHAAHDDRLAKDRLEIDRQIECGLEVGKVVTSRTVD